MDGIATRDGGFTLVELMVVVLIIGILITIAVPVYANASSVARAKACMANQRTVGDAIRVYIGDQGMPSSASAGQLVAGGSGWYAVLIPAWITSAPVCPQGETKYLMNAAGDIVGDRGATAGFKDGHSLP